MPYEKVDTLQSEIAVKGLSENNEITMIAPVATFANQYEGPNGTLRTHHIHAINVGLSPVLVREEGVEDVIMAGKPQSLMMHRIEMNVPAEIRGDVAGIDTGHGNQEGLAAEPKPGVPDVDDGTRDPSASKQPLEHDPGLQQPRAPDSTPPVGGGANQPEGAKV